MWQFYTTFMRWLVIFFKHLSSHLFTCKQALMNIDNSKKSTKSSNIDNSKKSTKSTKHCNLNVLYTTKYLLNILFILPEVFDTN